MPDETPLEQATKSFEITLGTTGTVVVTSLATYGALSLAKDVRRKAKKILDARQASKESAEPQAPAQS